MQRRKDLAVPDFGSHDHNVASRERTAGAKTEQPVKFAGSDYRNKSSCLQTDHQVLKFEVIERSHIRQDEGHCTVIE